MKIEIADINSIKPYENNPRKLSEKAIETVAMSLKEYGFRQPIVVDKDRIIVVGHTRFRASKKLGFKEVPITIADNLTTEQINAYRIADNRTAEESEWDSELLKMEIKDLEAKDFKLDLLGFNEDQLNDMLFEEKQGLTDEDEVPEAPEEPITKLGDIWKLGNHRLMCGDSIDIKDIEKLMNGQKADLVFTDPPYGISFKSEKGDTIKNDDLNNEKLFEFNSSWQSNADLVSKGDCFLMVWQSPRQFHLLDYKGKWKFFRLITMYKSNRISFPHGAWINKTEPCCIFSKGKPRITKQKYMDDCYVYKHDKESHKDSNVGHPTPKPVKMIEDHILACAKTEDLVLDLFGGSGSTLIACEKLNRNSFLMELDPKYCDVIIKRWENFTGLKAELENGQN